MVIGPFLKEGGRSSSTNRNNSPGYASLIFSGKMLNRARVSDRGFNGASGPCYRAEIVQRKEM